MCSEKNPTVYLVFLYLLMMEISSFLQPKLALTQGKMLLTQSSYPYILFGVVGFVLFYFLFCLLASAR